MLEKPPVSITIASDGSVQMRFGRVVVQMTTRDFISFARTCQEAARGCEQILLSELLPDSDDDRQLVN